MPVCIPLIRLAHHGMLLFNMLGIIVEIVVCMLALAAAGQPPAPVPAVGS
jgi:hypothetical protein